jgi:hypothetical protein
MNENRVQLERQIAEAIQPLAGQPFDQTFIKKIWNIVMQEIQHFNTQRLGFSADTVHWLHGQYVNHLVKIGTSQGIKTIGELSNQEVESTLDRITLIELYRLKTMFENTRLAQIIVNEINVRLDSNDRTGEKEQTS